MLLNNRYQIKKTLGSGGFGETFLAEDIQMPSKRFCVIKQLKPIQNNPQIYQLVKERFQREAATLEELGDKHNQIPSLYAYFQSNGLFYLVQEYIEGETLAHKVSKQGAISESIVREILVSLLQLLDYIHLQRIIHRDIKPDNIILRYQDGLPVLIDFGAVREIMGTAVNSQGKPTSTIVIGTPGYMSSEQAMGRPVFSSDLYSLGITAIHLLTGKQPEELETDSRTGEIIWHHHAFNVSPTLKFVVDKAISYNPRERFTTAKEMLEALQNGYTQLPRQTTPLTVVVQPKKTIYASINKSNGINPIIVGSLIIGVLTSGSVIASMMLTKTPQTAVQQSPSQFEPTINPQPPKDTQLPALNTPKTTDKTQAYQQSTTTNQTAITSSSLPTSVQQQTRVNSNQTSPNTSLLSPKTTDETFASQSTTTNQTAIAPSPLPTSVQQQTHVDSNQTSPNTSLPSPKTTNETQSYQQSTTTNQTAIAPSPLPTSVQQQTRVDSNQTSPNTSLPSPNTEVVNYYNNINSGRYQSAWDRLPRTLQENTNLHPNGYASFVSWWETVKSIDVQQVDVIQTNSNNAIVNTRLVYNMKAGNTKPVSLSYTLSWDNQTQKWKFIRIKSN
ncbi:serine/threonine kinase [Calothrix sp. NIES-4071]|nr:serine/threonine kinase [Calothrix sp. NIES-4071]BAZ58094.1 serine/threonine kinase [Calothrix sp. NIES-4105]